MLVLAPEQAKSKWRSSQYALDPSREKGRNGEWEWWLKKDGKISRITIKPEDFQG